MERKVKDAPSRPDISLEAIREAVKAVKYLKMDQLKAGYLYRIEARHANYGIWLPQRRSFITSRMKFGNNFLFEENHWDCESFATVKPLKEIEKSPFNANEINILYLEKEGKKIFEYQNGKAVIKYLNSFEPREHFFELLSKEEQNEIRKNWKPWR